MVKQGRGKMRMRVALLKIQSDDGQKSEEKSE